MVIELNQLLKMAVESKASDVHLTAGRAPSFRINGRMKQIEADKLTFEDTMAYARACMDKEKMEHLTSVGEVDFSITVPDVSRFRVNAFFQRGSIALVFRALATKIPLKSVAKLGSFEFSNWQLLSFT